MTPGDPWGGPRGAPQRGYPTRLPPSNNLNILRFWNVLENLFRHNTPKKWDRLNLGGPQASWGVFWGVRSPEGPPRLCRSHFFCLLCLNKFSKTFQKRRIFKLLLGGTQVGYPPWGGPPKDPGGPPGVPRCHRVLEKIVKIPNKYMKIIHESKSTKL